MRTELVHINTSKAMVDAEVILSFQSLHAFVEREVQAGNSLRHGLYVMLYEALNQQPHLCGSEAVPDLQKHTKFLQLIYAGMTDFTVAEEEHLWAMGLPLPSSVFYETDAFYKLIEQVKSEGAESDAPDASLAEVYSMLLKKCYGFDVLLSTEIVYSFFDKEAGYEKHYEVVVNNKFIDIDPLENLPQLSIENLEEQHHAGNAIPYLMEHLPLKNFRFTGFSVITLRDITVKQAGRQVRNVLLQNNTRFSSESVAALMSNLQSIVECSGVEFGFFPFVELNGKLLLQFADITQSLFVNSVNLAEMESFVMPGLHAFIEHPSSLFFNDLKSVGDEASPLLHNLKKTGYASFAIVPLYDDGQLVGALEIATHRSKVLTPVLVARLDPVLPHIAQMMKRGVDNFHRRINRTIRERFTAIQPAVEWKFKEAARTFLLQQWKGEAAPLPPVQFESVFPLYCAIDIKDSTKKRAEAKGRDLSEQLEAVLHVLGKLKTMGSVLPEALLKKLVLLQKMMSQPLNVDTEAQLMDFFRQEVNTYLNESNQISPHATALIIEYTRKLNTHTGLFYGHQEITEASIKMLNETILIALESFEAELQKVHPLYLESFRSDGVAHDVYAGPSITPAKVFDESIVQQFHLLQLHWMINITRRLATLKLPQALETTQLIYVHEERIDIGYREDERRFDVSNPYHIRYQVIKKRLDKAELSGIGERLTQPGKIAVVFSKSVNNAGYLSMIKQLQEEGLLIRDERVVQLEELAGIGILEAVQVSVKVENL